MIKKKKKNPLERSQEMLLKDVRNIIYTQMFCGWKKFCG